MPAQVVELAPCVGFPDDQSAVAIARGEQDSVGTELDGRDPLRVLLRLVVQLTVGRIVNAEDLARTAECNQTAVRTDVGGENNIIFFAEFKETLTRLHVPGDRASQLSSTSSARQQETAVTRKAETVDGSFGKR